MEGRLEEPEGKEKAPDPRVIMRREGRTLVYFALASGLAFLLLVGVRMILGEPQHAFDNAILVSLRDPANLATPVGPPWLLATARDITALGGWPVMSLLTAALSGYLATRREWGIIALVVSAVIGQSLIVHFLKDFIGRERPTVVPHLVDVSTLSFPSGHAASAAALYLVLGAILAREAQYNGQRVYVIAAAITLTLIIAASRVYLGVHYPTDVLAGLCVGAIWASIVWLAAYFIQHRK
jgi:undecaprenyl-diphosphatase